MLASILIASLCALSVSASDCKNTQNFPSTLKIGQIYPIIPQSDSGDNVKVSGSIKIISQCAFQFIDFSLSNAKASRDISVFGVATRNAFPLSQDILSGRYSHAKGPVIEFFDNSEFIVDSSKGGVAWSDFGFIRIYSKQTKTVLATIKLPEFGPAASPARDDTLDSTIRSRVQDAFKQSQTAAEESLVVPEVTAAEASKTVPAPVVADKVEETSTIVTPTGKDKASAQMYGMSVGALIMAAVMAVAM